VGFAYVAAILDAWSRRVVGYAISRSIDVRLAGGDRPRGAIPQAAFYFGMIRFALVAPLPGSYFLQTVEG
jgi:hypothetical protein